VLNEDPVPMTAYITGAETIRLRMEMGEDKGKVIQRNTVGVNEEFLHLRVFANVVEIFLSS